MSRQVRRVPPGWNHPTYFHKMHNGRREVRYLPLHAEKRYCIHYDSTKGEWLDGADPTLECMPEWSAEEATYYMMYEVCSNGTPISPSFPTPEALARWLTENNVGIFGSVTASYEDWLRLAVGFEESIGVFIDCSTGEVSPGIVPK